MKSIKSYIIVLVLLFYITTASSQVIKTIGFTGDYTSIGNAFTDINNGVITGAISLQINSNI